MSDTQRTRLVGHLPIAATQTGGGCLIIFALPFIAVGVFVSLLSLGYLPIKAETSNDAPQWVLTAFGGVFAAAGLALAFAGAAGMARSRGARMRKEEHPLEPWYWDHAWDSKGATSGGIGPAIHTFLTFVFLEAFLSIFHWWAFSSEEKIIPLMIFVGLFDLIALAILGGAIYQLFQYFKYGSSRLHFARFPFRPGDSVEAGLEAGRKIVTAPKIALTLRYIEEVMETTGSGKNRSTTQVLYCLHEVKQELVAGQFDAGSDLEIPISIRLPRGDYSNRLLETPRRYWELEVKAETPGIDYDARFLLPVYGTQYTQTMS
jgi:hypothetical protein